MQDISDAHVGRGKHDRRQRQAALRAAATAVFAEKGYDCATTREVAERAACAEGLIHRYFGGKHGLLLEVLRGRSHEAAAQLAARAPASDDLATELEALLAGWLDYAWEQRDFMRVCVARSVVDPEVGRLIGAELNQQRVAEIARKLRRHQEAGRLAGDVDVEAVADAIGGVMFAAGFFAQVVFEQDRAELERRLRAFARVLARGLDTVPAKGASA